MIKIILGINAVDGDAYNKAYTYDTIQEGIKAEAELLKKICNRRRMAEYYNKRPRQRSTTLDELWEHYMHQMVHGVKRLKSIY